MAVILCDTQVLIVAVIHAARTNSLDLNAYFPVCQLSLNAAIVQQQVREMPSSVDSAVKCDNRVHFAISTGCNYAKVHRGL